MNDSEPLRAAVLQHLEQVIDPETGVDVVRMRLIEKLTVNNKGHVRYVFRPSSPICPLAVPLAVEIRRAVREVPGVTGQTTQVEGYVRAEELTALLQELGNEPEQAAGSNPGGAPTGKVRWTWRS